MVRVGDELEQAGERIPESVRAAPSGEKAAAIANERGGREAAKWDGDVEVGRWKWCLGLD